MSSTSSLESIAAPRMFGRYRLLQHLGDGGMAAVWRARVEGPQGFVREVALKRVLADYSRDDEFVRALVHEARLSALLNHPGIVQVHELGRERDEYFLAMEYIEGCSLSALARATLAAERPLPIGLACHLVSELASALAYAHALGDVDGVPLGIVHRDVSPSNVMIARSGQVKLLDFGIAQAAARLRDERTRTGVLKGKLGYLAPEQIEGAAADRRSDLFALGVVFFECLTNQRLFAGSGLRVLESIRTAELLPPSTHRPDIPAEVDRIAMRLLARDPAARFASGDDLEEALQPLVHRLEGDGAALARFVTELGAFGAPPGRDPAATSIRLDERDIVRERTIAVGNDELAAMKAAVPRERTIALADADLLAPAPLEKREPTTVGLDELIRRDGKPEAPRPEPAAPLARRSAKLEPPRVTKEPSAATRPRATGERDKSGRVVSERDKSGHAVSERDQSGRRTTARPRERTATERVNRERSGEGTMRIARPDSAPRQLQWMAAFGVGAVVAVAFPVWLGMRDHPAPPVAAAPIAPITAPIAAAPIAAPPMIAPALPAAVARPADVRLRVDGTAGARLIVDGIERGQLPLELTLPAQPSLRTLQIEQAGYAPAQRQTRGDIDAQLEIVLKPLPRTSTHAAAGTKTSPSPPRPSHASGPAPAGEIESPF